MAKRPTFDPNHEREQSLLYTRTSKRALWVALRHLCAKDTGEYNAALMDGRWFDRLKEEITVTKNAD